MQEPVLVLNATYEPINVTAVRRAMVLMLKGVAQAEELHSAEVHSAAHSHRVPSVIRLIAYRHIPQQSRALSRKNILLRDRNTCQFCGRVFPSSELTLDHVVPRSRGGRSTWKISSPAATVATTARVTVHRKRQDSSWRGVRVHLRCTPRGSLCGSSGIVTNVGVSTFSTKHFGKFTIHSENFYGRRKPFWLPCI